MATDVYLSDLQRSARLWDDGVILPRDTRKILGKSFCSLRCQPPTKFSYFFRFVSRSRDERPYRRDKVRSVQNVEKQNYRQLDFALQ